MLALLLYTQQKSIKHCFPLTIVSLYLIAKAFILNLGIYFFTIDHNSFLKFFEPMMSLLEKLTKNLVLQRS